MAYQRLQLKNIDAQHAPNLSQAIVTCDGMKQFVSFLVEYDDLWPELAQILETG